MVRSHEESAEGKWIEYTSEDGAFRIEFPRAPEVLTTQDAIGKKTDAWVKVPHGEATLVYSFGQIEFQYTAPCEDVFKMAKVVIDASVCTGCGLCESNCPEVFKIEDDGIAHAIAQDCSEGHNLKEVAELCPVEAIVIN